MINRGAKKGLGFAANTGGILGNTRKIPTTLIASGDIEAARAKMGLALNLLQELSVKCGFRSIQAGAAAKREYRYDDGTVISLKINFGLSVIEVFVPVAVPGGEKNYRYSCPQLFKCFIFAIIDAVRPAVNENNGPQDVQDALVARERASYDVSFCFNGEYIVLSNYLIRSAGAEVYNVGQYVLLGPAPDSNFEPVCCVDNRSLASAVLDDPPTKLNTGFLDVYPVHILGDMIKKDLIETEIL